MGFFQDIPGDTAGGKTVWVAGTLMFFLFIIQIISIIITQMFPKVGQLKLGIAFQLIVLVAAGIALVSIAWNLRAMSWQSVFGSLLMIGLSVLMMHFIPGLLPSIFEGSQQAIVSTTLSIINP